MLAWLRTDVVRPMFMHAIISWATLQRHSQMRSAMKKAEFTDNASRITWIGALVNLALSVFKLVAGILGRSAAMVADAGHSFSDLISDAVTLFALRVSSLPADVDHPYGHGRFESVASLAIGALLVTAGASFGASAVNALRVPVSEPLGMIALWAALASILSKEVLFRVTAEIGERVNSPVLIANAWHHRSDALSSVVAIIGVGGALLGFPLLDPLAGILVGLMVAWMGTRIGLEALAQLTDTSDYEVVQAVSEVAGGVVGVRRVDHVRARSMGNAALVDLAIQVDPTLSASCAHRLAEEVRARVMDEASDGLISSPVSEVLVHVDTAPHDSTCPLQTHVQTQWRHYADVQSDVAQALLRLPQITAVPTVRVVYLASGLSVEAHVTAHDELTVAELRAVGEEASALVRAECADVADARIAVDLPPLGDQATSAERAEKQLAEQQLAASS